MNPLVRSLFHELADLSDSEREKVFAKQQVSQEIRAEIESLLSWDLQPGAEIDCEPYRAVRVLGAGGMGTVYLAERIDGEIQQKVAIKFLRTDIHRPAWRERFLKERQLLAYLNYPAIAHLIDVGHTKAGRPYLVMEYVDGIPIEEYAAKIELRDRLLVFLRVCDGVSYAHHRLVIHRDLKPSNILVDASGQPKLLDFGIAKLLDDGGNRTQTGEHMFTPNYASPEQLQGAAETTATDVYSLGAVLHKILTGYSPSENTESLTSLPIDLQYILRKALRTEPEERYDSAEALANDLRAFLEWKPVQARSGDTWYRARQFVRRYRVPVLATALLIAGLSVGLYAVNRERRIAQRRFDQVRQLSNKILALDGLIRTLPGSTKARSEIMAMSQQYLESLIAEGETSNDLALEVATAFCTLAEAQGVPIVANLGDSVQASENLMKADRLVEKVLTASSRNRKALLLSANINEDRMILANSDHHLESEMAFARKSAARLESFLATDTASDAEKFQASRAFANIALAFKNLHLYTESVRYGRRVLDLVPPNARKLDTRASALSIIADSRRYSGDLNGALETVLEAENAAQKSYFSNEDARVTSLQNIMWRHAMILGADGEISLRRTDEAIGVLQQAFDLIETAVKKDPNDASLRILFVQDGRELGNMLRNRDPEAALAVFDHARRRVGEIKDNAQARRGEAQLLAASSYPLRRLGRDGEAEQRINKALDLLRQTKNYPADAINASDELHTVLLALGDYLADEGRLQQATDVYEQLLGKLMASHPDPENDLVHATALSRVYGALTSLYRRNGWSEQANTTAELRIRLWQNWNRKLPGSPFIQQELSDAQTP